MRVLMLPQPIAFEGEESGIKRVVENYHRLAPKFGIKYVDCSITETDKYDLLAIHAGSYAGPLYGTPLIAHTHGLYFSADFNVSKYELNTNARVIATVRNAKEVTVPSRWVQETFQRDMHFSPHILNHGIEWQDWQHKKPHGDYVLWNKNRAADVCDPRTMSILARMRPKVNFATTFAPQSAPTNIKVYGVVAHETMKDMIQRASVYLSTTKETFGIGILEALAAGVPVLGFKQGGILETVQHGVNGYLARPGDYDDLADGLDYCLRYRATLGVNARDLSRDWTWERAVELLARIYQLAIQPSYPTVSIIIPSYNYGDKVERAIRSAMAQTYDQVIEIIVVDDGSTDDGLTRQVVTKIAEEDKRVRYVHQENAGVANARNFGISKSRGKYICCLDADDALAPEFIAACVPDLEHDPSLGIAYTGLYYIKPDGSEGLSPWPPQFKYDESLQRRTQIPTCCLYRREMWERLGGYRQRYAPGGAGEEDAEFWLRAGARGWGAKKTTEAGLFIYSWLSGRVSGNKEHQVSDYTSFHPWVKDNNHPLASLATPKNKISHLVRQYDEPRVSVIIPVSRRHRLEVVSALDSLEAQTFRNWEAIIAWDFEPSGEEQENVDYLRKAFPFIRETSSNGKGAGAARNRGAEMARGSLLLFLDADDWLYPEAIEKMVALWELEEAIIYGDYIGKAFVSYEFASKAGDKLLHYNQKRGEAVIRYNSATYDYDRAVQQPNPKDMYIWNLISSLVPKRWHDEVGGFDEDMPSWEDWDYWVRLAREGKCFVRLPEPLVVYRFYTGTRREYGLQENRKLIEYMRAKYEHSEVKVCNCHNKSNAAPLTSGGTTPPPGSPLYRRTNQMAVTKDSQMIPCLYDHPNRGKHRVYGMITHTFYGYRGGGERFLVDERDIAAQPHIYKPIATTAESEKVVAPPAPPPVPISPASEPAPEPEQVKAIFDLQSIPGVNSSIAAQLNMLGVFSLEDIVRVGVEGLMQVKGVAERRAQIILDYARKEGQLE